MMILELYRKSWAFSGIWAGYNKRKLGYSGQEHRNEELCGCNGCS